MAILVGTPIVDGMELAHEIAMKQHRCGKTLDSLIHREATKESLGEDWLPFEKMTEDAIRRFSEQVERTV